MRETIHMQEKQVKSKQRVADRGEVFTAEREVNAMLDLVKQETERIESRFLEPACGEGAFLTEILRRKLAVVKHVTAKVRSIMNAMPFLQFRAFTALISLRTMPRYAAATCLIFGTGNIPKMQNLRQMMTAERLCVLFLKRTFYAGTR